METHNNFKAQAKRRRKQALLVQGCLSVTIVALVFGISYTTVKMLHGEPLLTLGTAVQTGEKTSLSAAASQTAQSGAASGGAGSTAAQAAAAAQAWDTVVPLPRTINMEVMSVDSRMLALPANGRVSTEFFRTALFIGDSLSQGFGIYEPLRNVAQFCAYKSTSPKAMLENGVAVNVGQKTGEPMLDSIFAKQPSTIYLLLGTNALLAQDDEAFLHYYGQLMDVLREHFAGVPIYVQSITPVTSEQEVKQPRLANSHIRSINNAVAQMAVSKGMYYVDVQEALADDTGVLRADYVGTYDGIHMNPRGYAEWVDYLATHTAYSPYNAQFVTEGPYT